MNFHDNRWLIIPVYKLFGVQGVASVVEYIKVAL